MTVRGNDYQPPEPTDYLGALKLAVEAGANMESTVALITKILEDSPNPPAEALWPTRLLVEAIQELQGTVDVP